MNPKHTGTIRSSSAWSTLVATTIVSLLVAAFVISAFFLIPTGATDDPAYEELSLAAPERIHYIYDWDDEKDSQGSYTSIVANLYILLRANGSTISKEIISAIIPDPDIEWNQLPSRINEFIPQGIVALSTEGIEFTDLPAPSIISLDGSKYVVFLYADYNNATVANPETGIETYNINKVIKKYNESGQKALFIVDQGYTVNEHPDYK